MTAEETARRQRAWWTFALTSGGIPALLCCLGVLWGLRRNAATP